MRDRVKVLVTANSDANAKIFQNIYIKEHEEGRGENLG
jgi:hypothetical protein